MLTNRLAHGLTGLRISNAFLQRPASNSDRPGGNIDPTYLKTTSGHEEALAFFTANQAEFSVALIASIDKLAAINALVAELGELVAIGDAGQVFHGLRVFCLRDQNRHAFVTRLRRRIGFAKQSDTLAFDGVGDPSLGTFNHILIADARRLGRERLQVGARVRFCQSKTAAEFTSGELWQPIVFLLIRSEALNNLRHHQVRIEDACETHPLFGNASDDFRVKGSR